MDEWVSITEAADRLTAAGDAVERSTLSRYLAQHSDALEVRIEGKSKLVEFGALRQHRAENVRLRQAPRAMSGPAGGQGSTGQRRFAGTQSDGAARKVTAEAEMRELDLAERRGELTPTAEVDKAGRDAVALMQSAFERAIESEAATASVKYGLEERIWRIALKSFARRGLDVFNQEIRARLDQEERLALDERTMSGEIVTTGALQ